MRLPKTPNQHILALKMAIEMSVENDFQNSNRLIPERRRFTFTFTEAAVYANNFKTKPEPRPVRNKLT
jgi:hypothetical protein